MHKTILLWFRGDKRVTITFHCSVCTQTQLFQVHYQSSIDKNKNWNYYQQSSMLNNNQVLMTNYNINNFYTSLTIALYKSYFHTHKKTVIYLQHWKHHSFEILSFFIQLHLYIISILSSNWSLKNTFLLHTCNFFPWEVQLITRKITTTKYKNLKHAVNLYSIISQP